MESVEQSFSGPDNPKALGAFYTDVQVADFLVWWAVRSGQDSVLDPSFGGGVFLRSASKRLRQMGGDPSEQVFGVEIDQAVHARISEKLGDEFGVSKDHLLLADFFDVSPSLMRKVDAVVGNPPFIRFHRFKGEPRHRALARAEDAGVRLSELSSSWAPFLVHSTTLLKNGGRLAMVMPVEINHAAYAVPVLEFLANSYNGVTFLTFRKKLFPDLSEDTLLLLAEDRGPHRGKFLWLDLAHAGRLVEFQRAGRTALPGTRMLDTTGIATGRQRLVENFVSPKARDLYRELCSLATVRRLGQLADVGIGYVTGANQFFHLDLAATRRWRIPEAYLSPAIRRGRGLTGLRFTCEDWQRALESGEGAYLLRIEREHNLPESIRRYLQDGERQGIPRAYKCRMRKPWFRVPHVYRPDAFLSYMSGTTPRLVSNDAEVIAPNSLHIIRLKDTRKIGRDALAALWQTSLTRLSAEIEGHALGGGMLKLEPTEAENVLIPLPASRSSRLAALANELDRLVRDRQEQSAQARADEVLLKQELGLHSSDCRLLAEAAETLKQRRYARSAN
jgi:hypothetical protein